jgi:hypothetical protein
LEDLALTGEFCSFLNSVIPAVEAAELLLLFRSRSSEWLSADEAAERLEAVASPASRRYLDLLVENGLLATRDGRWHYLSDNRHAPLVDLLALAYSQRPVTLIRLIHGLPDPAP